MGSVAFGSAVSGARRKYQRLTTTALAVAGILTASLLISTPAVADVVVADIPVGTAPRDLIVGQFRDEKIYVVTDSGLSIIEKGTHRVTTVDVGGVPQDVAIHLGRVYVSVSTGAGKPGTVVMLNSFTGEIAQTYPTGVDPRQVVANESNGKIYVAFKTGVMVMQVGLPDETVPLPETPTDMAFSPINHNLYVANGNAVTVIDKNTNATTSIDLGASVTRVAASYTSNNTTFATTVSQNKSSIVAINGFTNATSTVYETFGTLGEVLTDGNFRLNVAASNGMNGSSVMVFDTDTKTKIAEVGTNGESGKMGGLRGQSSVYVPNLAGGVTIIDHNYASSTVRTGNNPVAAAVDMDNRKAYVANKGSNTVTVIDANIPAPVKNDFNGDRKTDVLARDAAGRLWLYPGNGAGGWLPKVQVGSGWNVMTALIAPGDFNGDGTSDVLARDSAGTLWLYPGNGTGGWFPRKQVGAGWSVMTAITAASDFNGDGKVDVLARDGSGLLWLYPGNGSGGWLSRVQVGSGWTGMSGIMGVGDFNGDGTADVASRDGAGTLWLYPGNGFGGWLAPRKTGSGWNVMNTLVGPGDFSGDGKADILARDSAGVLWLYSGSGGPAWPIPTKIGQGWEGMTVIL
ncbi:FG-GAP-like repeat-containing protein [Arthrobacter sp. ISL-95]|uniref:FG-GAP-like repeat-containing protein n=1 Tax=Arthrobacter sp. ISL-95 TaxID=2819116 RepID=UPI001BE692B5|nr:FG-GAP-like repeat-containing protein [Arthrobacter sp. ISL-95]MBT2584503.1 VCBS repeat-containing protein [Arthrobacter sp. ISL-95]